MRYRVWALIALLCVAGWIGLARAAPLTTASGYALRYEVYQAPGPFALIFMHGKNGVHDSPSLKDLAINISKAGFTVYLPLMPWSKNWDGTADDATSIVDALVDLAAKDGKKVFVGGQSMGAMFAIAYRPGGLPPAVVGKVLTSPGGLLDITAPNAPTITGLQASVNKAKALEADGKGKVKTRFTGFNTQGDKSIEETYDTTPEIFLSFHDVARAPSVRKGLASNSVPVFWSAGSRDPIGNNKKSTFDKMRSVPGSLYVESNGDHNTNMTASIEPIIAWMKARTAQ